MDTGLRTNALAVGYGNKVVLSGVDIQVEPGKVVCLIGPNGSGKSTILKTITKQLKKKDGKILLLDKDMDSMKADEIAVHMSMVMTNRIDPELMTCREVVETGRYPYTGRLGVLTNKDKDVVANALAFVKAENEADRLFSQISDGQRQRIMLARAICQEPDVLVLDEPTSFLDIGFKLELLRGIIKLAREKNIAIIMSLHEIELASKIADTIVALNGDKVVKAGTPEEIFKDSFVQNLYGINEQEYNPLSCELHFILKKDEPQVFVIGGGGAGLHVYHRLQREGVAFACGIIAKNDIEYAEASALASKGVFVEAFHEITDEEVRTAKDLIDKCDRVILAIDSWGPLNEKNRMLLEYAKQQGKLEE